MATKYVKNAFKNVSLLCNILQQHFIVMLGGNSIIYSYSQHNIISPPHTGTNVNIQETVNRSSLWRVNEAISLNTASELDEERATASAYSNVSTNKLKLLTRTQSLEF
jgi:hypothetical protein